MFRLEKSRPGTTVIYKKHPYDLPIWEVKEQGTKRFLKCKELEIHDVDWRYVEVVPRPLEIKSAKQAEAMSSKKLKELYGIFEPTINEKNEVMEDITKSIKRGYYFSTLENHTLGIEEWLKSLGYKIEFWSEEHVVTWYPKTKWELLIEKVKTIFKRGKR